ncbi:Zn(2)-C6 fungal-type domain-containing protein [Mycena chlorophos]|uniref:Zn(2)-C6 fungal-type domain-containing protein n=1 Tax=Mycena chlorophos TaxID=658473 RepID=A0A8H6VTX5_MYCCL|nr:Zn(2)-C6 fungal-type domain-containing protein [Mycena chlorophos]
MPKGTTGPRARYAHQACDVCRLKKVKCDGVKPVCGPCLGSRRELECAWLKEPVRKPRTEAHFEALRKRADALEAYSKQLEQRLAQCTCSISRDTAPVAPDFALLGRGDTDGEEVSDDEGDITRELCLPTERLQLDDRDLLSLGSTTPFRFKSMVIPTLRPDPFPSAPIDPGGVYVLLLDGADEAQCSPEVNWRMYLPSELPFDRREHDRLLDIVFKYFTSWCMRVVPALFLRHMYRYIMHRGPQRLKTAHYSPMLHNAILALAATYSDDPAVRNIEARRAIAAHAKTYPEPSDRAPTLDLGPNPRIKTKRVGSIGADWQPIANAFCAGLVRRLRHR